MDRAKELVGKGMKVHNDQSDSFNVQTSQSDWAAGLQPLHAAARGGLKELCELFLNAGAIVSMHLREHSNCFNCYNLLFWYSYIVVVTMVTQHYIMPVTMDTSML